MSEAPTFLQTINASSSPEVQMNENGLTLEAWALFGKNPATSTGLTWGYFGGRWGGTSVASGTVTLTGAGSPTPTNYIVAHRQTGAVSVSTGTTNWNDVATYARLYKVPCTASAVITAQVEDHRAGPYGPYVKPGIIWRQATDNDTLVLTDADNGVAMNAATAKTITIPANATVAFPKGISILLAGEGAGSVTIAAAGGVTLRVRANTSPFLNQIAGQYGIAVIVQRNIDEWILTGDIA